MSTDSTPKFVVRDARPEDCTAIYQMIYDLSVYEKMPEKVTITAETLKFDGFGQGHPPRFYALVVEKVDKHENALETVGYSIYNDIYCTFRGRLLWIEDIFVAEKYRKFGLAGAIIRKLATFAEREKIDHIDWNVLAWNQLAIGFYHSIGAVNVSDGYDGLNLFRLTEEKYKQLLEKPFVKSDSITIEY